MAPDVLSAAMIDWAKEQPSKHYCFINSDIELDHNPLLLSKIRKQLITKMVIAHRHDYEKDKSEGLPYILGIDAFFLHQDHLHIYPTSLLCVGQCFWDYHMPFTAIKNGIEVINLQNRFAFHKKHPVQYSAKNWETTGKMFAIEHGIQSDDIGRINELTFNFLKLHTQKVTL